MTGDKMWTQIRLANRPRMAGIVPELTHGVPCPGRGSFCPGNVKIDHRAWMYGCSLMSVLYFVLCLSRLYPWTPLSASPSDSHYSDSYTILCLYRKINLNLFLWKRTKTRAGPFGSDMHQIVCRLGLCPDPTGRAYSIPPDPLAGLEGGAPGKREGGKAGGKGEGEGEGKEGRGGKGVPECLNPELASLNVTD